MTAIIRVPKQKTEELKSMIEEGLHVFGKVMNLCEQMCEESEMGERMGMRGGYGMREEGYPEAPYAESEAYGDRRGMRGTGRYSRY